MIYKKISILLKVIILFFLMYSCETYYYYPTRHNVLQFKEKGDANISFGKDLEMFNSYSAGYSITNNIALISDFKTFYTYSIKSDMRYKIDDYLWDNELILYKYKKNHIYQAVNIGIGFGQINRNTEYNYQVNRQYVQPSLGFSNDYFDIAISSKISRINHQIDKYKEDEYSDLKDVGTKDFYFLEPAITVGCGYKFIKLRYQYIALEKLNNANLKYNDNMSNLSLFLTFNVNKLFQGD